MAALVPSVIGSVSYIDVGAGFNLYSPQLLLYNARAVYNEISNVLNTPIGSEPWEPTFGCDWELELFDNPTDVSGWKIANSITTAIRKWILWITIGRVRVQAQYDQGLYAVSMPYIIPALNLNGRYTASLGIASPSSNT
jgi:phage baseplate assembly protein W